MWNPGVRDMYFMYEMEHSHMKINFTYEMFISYMELKHFTLKCYFHMWSCMWNFCKGSLLYQVYVVFLTTRIFLFLKHSFALLTWHVGSSTNTVRDDKTNCQFYTLVHPSCYCCKLCTIHIPCLSVMAYPQDTIVVYDSSLWRMRLCHKSIIPACYSFANVAVDPEDSYNWIGYVKMNNCMPQSHLVNGSWEYLI